MLLTLTDIHAGINRVEQAFVYFAEILYNSYVGTVQIRDNVGNQANYPQCQRRYFRNAFGTEYIIYEIAIPLKEDSSISKRYQWQHSDEIEPNAIFPNAYKSANLP